MFLRSLVVSASIVFTASASLADISDSCLIGTWVPDEGAFAAQLTSNPAMGEAEISGDVQMIFTEAGGRYVLDGMVIKVQNPAFSYFVEIWLVMACARQNPAHLATCGVFMLTT